MKTATGTTKAKVDGDVTHLQHAGDEGVEGAAVDTGDDYNSTTAAKVGRDTTVTTT